MKVTNNKYNDDKYKDDNYQYLKSNVSIINKTEEEEALIERLISINLPLKVLNYVIGNISSCWKKMIEFKNKIKYQEKINGNIVMLFHYCHC